ncbi:MAG: efflux RND transporter permease subunit [Zoogloeaceae bacterium]|jgi:multidrug efflux pump|nr:efflux RND transporter permease subunit [Zoogloeaceae bacterium]
MNITEKFIHRPVATTLLTLGVALLGIAAWTQLPVSLLPQVEFPVVSVRASLPGASPETMASSVTTPLERTLGVIPGVNEITSRSMLGSSDIVLQFDLKRTTDSAAKDVEAAVSAARAQLPSGMTGNPSVRKMSPDDAPVISLSLTSDVLSKAEVYDAAVTLLSQKLAQIRGVGQVSVSGSSLPAVRVELNPQALARYGIGAETVRNAIANANVNRPKGILEQGEHYWQITANDQAIRAADYRPLILAWKDGAPVRLSDVAEVIDGDQDIRNAGLTNGKPSVQLRVQRAPNSNIIEIADAVYALMPQLQAALPDDIKVEVSQDRSTSIRAALHDVSFSLVVAVCLVIMVVMLFLRDRRAALIPAVAVPVSIIGSLAVMYLFGFSLNNLSLMALTVATGFVVDDAVVMLENITRQIEHGVPPLTAALQGAREVGFTVFSMSLSLIAVFIPVMFMDGLVGRILREFAITLSAAILISLLVSLATTPMMCARLLRPQSHQPKQGRISRLTETGIRTLQQGYKNSLGWVLDHAPLTMLILALTILLNITLYGFIPKGFFPEQDLGRIRGNFFADQSISFQAMREKLADFVYIVQQDPDVSIVTGTIGGGGGPGPGQRNSGDLSITLKPRPERKASAQEVVNRLRPLFSQVAGTNISLSPVQEIRIGGRAGNASNQLALLSDDMDTLLAWRGPITEKLGQLPELTDVSVDGMEKSLQTTLAVDREQATRLGLTQRDIDSTLNDFFGQSLVSTIYNPLNQYRVVMEAAPRYWQSPESLADIVLVTRGGERVPLSAIAHWEPTFAPLAVFHISQFAGLTLSYNLAAGVSLGDATIAINNALAEIGVPVNIHVTFMGTAQALRESLDSQVILIVSAIIAVYLVLGILYESLIHPITILSTLPSAGIGALLALLACNTEFSIIALIGVILLIGIVKKNAIMMVDFALQAERGAGLSPREAIFKACQLRFRPIMMTTLAAIFGAIPLALGQGDGAELRQPLGIAIVGGLLLSQLLTLYTTPVVYLYLDRFRLWSKTWRGEPLHPEPALHATL